MSATATASPVSFGNLWWIFRAEKTEMDVAARPSDGLVVFAVMWGMASLFSVASGASLLQGDRGLPLMVLSWGALAASALLVMNPRETRLLMLVAGLMMARYAMRMPVSSNNQTISFFMDAAILIAVSAQAWRNRGTTLDREIPYEQLRVVARALLATMYFFGIFHKINTGFLEPLGSCATALYQPLARPFGLDENVVGMYLAIIATFVVEGIAIVCLYWRRFFWVGLVVSLPFHFVIPISGFSWYMDFSSLVFALYMLSVPREVASGLYSTGVSLVRRAVQFRAGVAGLLALAAAWGIAGTIVIAQAYFFFPGRSLGLIWHSAWLLVWTLFGGIAMLLIIRAALLQQPYKVPVERKLQSPWVYGVPAVLFLTCLSPYVGLKTESSIAMFSNLHTEGGVSNHLLFAKPPYLFENQANVGRITDSNDPALKKRAEGANFGLVEHDIALRLTGNPDTWISYTMNGRHYERVTAETFTGHRPNLLERKLLDFKPVDWGRPKVCTH